jgi:hypothetical protein
MRGTEKMFMLLSRRYVSGDHRYTLDTRHNIRAYNIPQDYYEAKEVDRKLSYFLVKSDSIVCDVGGLLELMLSR